MIYPAKAQFFSLLSSLCQSNEVSCGKLWISWSYLLKLRSSDWNMELQSKSFQFSSLLLCFFPGEQFAISYEAEEDKWFTPLQQCSLALYKDSASWFLSLAANVLDSCSSAGWLHLQVLVHKQAVVVFFLSARWCQFIFRENFFVKTHATLQSIRLHTLPLLSNAVFLSGKRGSVSYFMTSWQAFQLPLEAQPARPPPDGLGQE